MDQYAFVLYCVVIPGIIIIVLTIASAYEQLKYHKHIQTNREWLNSLNNEEYSNAVCEIMKKCNGDLAGQEFRVWYEWLGQEHKTIDDKENNGQ